MLGTIPIAPKYFSNETGLTIPENTPVSNEADMMFGGNLFNGGPGNGASDSGVFFDELCIYIRQDISHLEATHPSLLGHQPGILPDYVVLQVNQTAMVKGGNLPKERYTNSTCIKIQDLAVNLVGFRANDDTKSIGYSHTKSTSWGNKVDPDQKVYSNDFRGGGLLFYDVDLVEDYIQGNLYMKVPTNRNIFGSGHAGASNPTDFGYLADAETYHYSYLNNHATFSDAFSTWGDASDFNPASYYAKYRNMTVDYSIFIYTGNTSLTSYLTEADGFLNISNANLLHQGQSNGGMGEWGLKNFLTLSSSVDPSSTADDVSVKVNGPYYFTNEKTESIAYGEITNGVGQNDHGILTNGISLMKSGYTGGASFFTAANLDDDLIVDGGNPAEKIDIYQIKMTDGFVFLPNISCSANSPLPLSSVQAQNYSFLVIPHVNLNREENKFFIEEGHLKTTEASTSDASGNPLLQSSLPYETPVPDVSVIHDITFEEEDFDPNEIGGNITISMNITNGGGGFGLDGQGENQFSFPHLWTTDPNFPKLRFHLYSIKDSSNQTYLGTAKMVTTVAGIFKINLTNMFNLKDF